MKIFKIVQYLIVIIFFNACATGDSQNIAQSYAFANNQNSKPFNPTKGYSNDYAIATGVLSVIGLIGTIVANHKAAPDDISTAEYDKSDFNTLITHREADAKYDLDGYDKKGYNEDGYDRKGYDKKGYNSQGLDKNNFDKNGTNRTTSSSYDEKGYDKEGFDNHGYSRTGYNKNGYDKNLKTIEENIQTLEEHESNTSHLGEYEGNNLPNDDQVNCENARMKIQITEKELTGMLHIDNGPSLSIIGKISKNKIYGQVKRGVLIVGGIEGEIKDKSINIFWINSKCKINLTLSLI